MYRVSGDTAGGGGERVTTNRLATSLKEMSGRLPWNDSNTDPSYTLTLTLALGFSGVGRGIGRGHRVSPAGLPIEQVPGEYSLS